MAATLLKGSKQELCKVYSLALLDLDGVVYRGAQPVEHAAQAIQMAGSAGMKAAYTTNNPSRYPNAVAEQLRSFGIELDDQQVITSAIVGARMLREHLPHEAKVLVIGSDHLRDEVRRNGMVVVESSHDHPQAVIQSWYPEIDFDDLAQAAYSIEQGARYFVTNRDLTLPREDGIAPGNGAMQLPVIAATGTEPEDSAGKPEAAMYDEARRLFGTESIPLDKQVSLPVGDRLDTDIEAANRGGYDSLVVLTGVADPESILRAPQAQRPTYIASDLQGLLEKQPEVRRNGEADWVCRSCRASYINGQLTLSAMDGQGNAVDPLTQIDALRAAACTVWEAVDNGSSINDITLPQFRLLSMKD
ncbi:HAD-IIA family hydrolase [Bombiscardovia coagulans]|uniref:Hydrolase n=1 Tax=Bombiscardovia coagulans TaxID=686666 RepID=A0A261ET83_9BIFI|nr:HAD-IIA family hydrolase [Bombiscardovia coagulans]OZG50074.1 hydrolase [Bombiscardovia coagulans]